MKLLDSMVKRVKQTFKETEDSMEAKESNDMVVSLSPKRSKAVRPTLITPTKEKEGKNSKQSIPSSRKLRVNTDGAISDDSDSVLVLSIKSPVKRIFGRETEVKTVQSNTQQVYNLVKHMTGSIGGNGHGGAIYGELTVGSMQKMIDLMKIHTGLGPNSRFIDVGSGLGKPNLHVAQDPGVEFSYGIEMEHVRWVLGMSNLKVILDQAYKQELECTVNVHDKIGHRCIFHHGDITDAKFFDPFTHVYMFDIGFPPNLFKTLADMFNRSQSEYLICYHSPREMVDRYGFNVELIIQTPTSMHGSSEGHMGYIYRRKGKTQTIGDGLDMVDEIPCDKLFTEAWMLCKEGIRPLLESVKQKVEQSLNSERPSRKRKMLSKE